MARQSAVARSDAIQRLELLPQHSWLANPAPMETEKPSSARPSHLLKWFPESMLRQRRELSLRLAASSLLFGLERARFPW